MNGRYVVPSTVLFVTVSCSLWGADPAPAKAEQGSDWGEAIAGAQARVVVSKADWPPGQTVVFRVTVRSAGSQPTQVASLEHLTEVQWDGQWYYRDSAAAMVWETLAPGRESPDVYFRLALEWRHVRDGRPLVLSPGTHTLRIAAWVRHDDIQRARRATSGRVRVRILPGRRPVMPRLPVDLPGLWELLSVNDSRQGMAVVEALARRGPKAVPFLASHLEQRAQHLRPEGLRRLLRELDAPKFAVREQATAELASIRHWVWTELHEVLASDPEPEVAMRIRRALALPNPSGKPLPVGRRLGRAVLALELIGTPEARAVLNRLAREAPPLRYQSRGRAAWKESNVSPYMLESVKQAEARAEGLMAQYRIRCGPGEKTGSPEEAQAFGRVLVGHWAVMDEFPGSSSAGRCGLRLAELYKARGEEGRYVDQLRAVTRGCPNTLFHVEACLRIGEHFRKDRGEPAQGLVWFRAARQILGAIGDAEAQRDLRAAAARAEAGMAACREALK